MASEKQQAFLSQTRQALCDDFIKGVINSTHPFTKSWQPGEFKAAYNAVSGKRYRGVNAINLAGAGYSDPRWMTFNQGKEKNYRLRKGARSMPIIFWTLQRRLLQQDDAGRPVRDARGEKQYVDVQLQSPICQVYRVFNARDFEGIEPIAAAENDEMTQTFMDKGLADVKARIERSGAVIRHDQDNRCFYHPVRDEIHMVPASQFDSEAAYVSTLFHELGHWTGHAIRLNRDLANPFGSQGYAREELRAEFFSFFANIEYGIGFDIRSHQAYLKHWVEILRDDPDELFRAARDADRIAAYLHQLTSEATQDMNTDKTAVEGPVASADLPSTKQYLAVSFHEKDDFKAVCIQHAIRYGWDKEAKAWYVEHEPGADLGMFRRWALQKHTLPAPASVSHESIMADFATVLEEAGLILSGVPVMDGNIQRVPVDGAKPGRKDGAYAGYLDGVPNGWYQNYRDDIKGKWVSSREVGTVVTVAEKARSAQKKLERDNERQQRREKALEALSEALAGYSGILNDHPYAVRKGLTVSPDTDSELRISKMGSLVIPLYNTDGLLQSAQWIASGGEKGIYKDTVKTGAFAVTHGGRATRITTTPEYCTGRPRDMIILAEGWATAKTIAEHIRQPVIFAVDSANLVTVAEAWRAKWPDANILICADSDSERSQNKGQIYGEKAAAAVDGMAIFPPFPSGVRGTDYNDLQVELLRQGHAPVAVNNLIQNQIVRAMAKLKIRTLQSIPVAECALT